MEITQDDARAISTILFWASGGFALSAIIIVAGLIAAIKSSALQQKDSE